MQRGTRRRGVERCRTASEWSSSSSSDGVRSWYLSLVQDCENDGGGVVAGSDDEGELGTTECRDAGGLKKKCKNCSMSRATLGTTRDGISADGTRKTAISAHRQ